ncbi:MAG: hypothetical protein V3U83_01980, partial [Acidobacteriota bacterium]
WPIVGVISRATGDESERTFKVYKGHDEVSQWQFHVFERGIQLPEGTGGGKVPRTQGGIGPGFGGKPLMRGFAGQGGARPGGRQRGQGGLGQTLKNKKPRN